MRYMFLGVVVFTMAAVIHGEVRPKEFLQNPSDYHIYLNMIDTAIQNDIQESDESIVAEKRDWHEGWRNLVRKEAEGFSFYDGQAKEAYWAKPHLFSGKAAQAFAVLEMFSIDFVVYQPASDPKVVLDSASAIKTVSTLCPSLGIREDYVLKVKKRCEDRYEEITTRPWPVRFAERMQEFKKKHETYMRALPLVTGPVILPVFSTFLRWYNGREAKTQDVTRLFPELVAVEKTKGDVLYETLIEDQLDRVEAQKIIERQAQEAQHLREQIEEQHQIIAEMKKNQEEALKGITNAEAGALVIGVGNTQNVYEKEIQKREMFLTNMMESLKYLEVCIATKSE